MRLRNRELLTDVVCGSSWWLFDACALHLCPRWSADESCEYFRPVVDAPLFDVDSSHLEIHCIHMFRLCEWSLID